MVSVSSEGVGKGAEFVVRLPLTPAPEPPPGAEGPVPTPPTSGPARRRALVVDDDPDTTSSIRALLDAWGFDSAVANDGLSALQQARELRPDVVLLDIALPDMNGHELAEKLRELTGAGGPILIAISGFGPDACTGGESTHVGVDHHLVKPVDPDRLHELLTTLGTGSVAAEGRGEVERG